MQKLQILDVPAENGIDFRVLVVTKEEGESTVEFTTDATLTRFMVSSRALGIT